MRWMKSAVVLAVVLLPIDVAGADVVCKNKKSGALAVRADGCKKKEDVYTGLTRPTVAGFSRFSGSVDLTANSSELTKLSDPMGSGPLVVTSPTRLVLTGAVNVENMGLATKDAEIGCQLEVSTGSGFALVGSEMRTEAPGNDLHDERHSIALVGVADEPAGTYDARITCRASIIFTSAIPQVREAALGVVAIPQ